MGVHHVSDFIEEPYCFRDVRRRRAGPGQQGFLRGRSKEDGQARHGKMLWCGQGRQDRLRGGHAFVRRQGDQGHGQSLVCLAPVWCLRQARRWQPDEDVMSESSATNPIPAQAGIGLRMPHHGQVLATRPQAAWFEVHPENFMANDSALAELERVREDYPLSLHAVGLSLGSAGGVDRAHLERLRQLRCRVEPGLVSDHLSWSVHGGQYLPHPPPLPYSEGAPDIVCRHVERGQQALGTAILVENPSTHLRFAAPVIPEAQFLPSLARRPGCGVLFDVNNVYVSACNQRSDAGAVLADW